MMGSFLHSFPLSALPGLGVSAIILVTLAVILAGSGIMFRILTLRAIEQRHEVAMREWGQQRGMRFVKNGDDVPLPALLTAVSPQRVHVRFCLMGKQIALIQFESHGLAGPAPVTDLKMVAGVWNVLVREIESDWPPSGLRPSASVSSVMDLFSLTSFEMLGTSERFVIHGTEAKAAVVLSRSAARGLLPPDVGLMMHHKRLVLDFSNRPFDAIEFERMMAVAEQLVAHLPAPPVKQ